MKKRILEKLSMLLIVCMLLGISTHVQAAPSIEIAEPMSGLQYIKGAPVVIPFYFTFDGFEYCNIDIEIYSSDGNLVERIKDERLDSDNRWGGKAFVFPILTDDADTGKYKVKFYTKYFTESGWKRYDEAPKTFTYKVVNQNSRLNGLAVTPEGYVNYYKNGEIDTSYCGFAGGDSPCWYVKNGVVDGLHEGAVYDTSAKEWKYVEYSLWNEEFEGVGAAEDGTWYYFYDGKVNERYTGGLIWEGKDYYIENGIATEECKVTGEKHTFVDSLCTSCGNMQFVDVQKKEFYYKAVEWALKNGITKGISDKLFSPAGECNRAQAVTFLWRAAGSPEPIADANPFTDVGKERYYYKAVLWAVEQGITNGTSATTFSPDDTCTRGQIVTFLFRAAESPEIANTNHPFTDIMPERYYVNAVLWAVEENITKGMTETTFAPEENCTRGQIVTFLYRYYN